MSSTTDRLTRAHVSQVAAIHADALRGDFLPSLGAKFLEELYAGLLDSNLGFGFVTKDDGRVTGFVIGCRDSGTVFSQTLRKRFLRLGMALCVGIARNPRLILNTLETVLYPSKERIESASAELFVIAVADGWRGRGLGSQLVECLDREFRAQGIRRYKVTVHADKVDSNRFYKQLGFAGAGEFTLYRRQWNVYIRTLAEHDAPTVQPGT